MKLKAIDLTEFTAFGSAHLELSPGVNVLIGANGTGKTHAMKVAYSTLKVLAEKGSGLVFRERLREKLARVFRPDDGQIGRLVRRRPGQGSAKIEVATASEVVTFTIYSKDSSVRVLKSASAKSAVPALFLPSRELLAIFEGFIAAYQQRELAFDETYFDTMVALSAAALRGARPEALERVLRDLRKMTGGKVVRRGDRFYVTSRAGNLEAHLVAEGLRKLGSVAHLISNGSLREQGLLFWDEPEANLNPLLVRHVADALASLASSGLQTVVATHDYLLTRTLAWHAERRVPVRFFVFEGSDDGVAVHYDDDLDSLPQDPIRAAFLDLYDRERGIETSKRCLG